MSYVFYTHNSTAIYEAMQASSNSSYTWTGDVDRTSTPNIGAVPSDDLIKYDIILWSLLSYAQRRNNPIPGV